MKTMSETMEDKFKKQTLFEIAFVDFYYSAAGAP